MNRLTRVSQSVLMLAFVAGALGFAGCAEEVGTLDRTRPDRVDKSIFQNDDEWYFRQTIIETDFQGSYGLFEGLETPLKRIQWTITEDTLFAHTTVEPAIGGSKNGEERQDKLLAQKGKSGGFDKRLGVVAAFPITSHFDVQRGYNPQTGQLSNVLSENTSDKLWFDRKYMRVDWGRMSVDSFGYASMFGSLASVTRTPGEVNPEADPNRTRVSEDVVDTVTEYYFEPDMMSCFSNFGLDSIGACEAGALKVRSYFMKMPKKQTYQPQQYIDQETFLDDNGHLVKRLSYLGWDGAKCDEATKDVLRANGRNAIDECKPVTFDLFNRFGYFRTERSVYTPERAKYGDQRLYFANRWNIWQDSFDKDGNVLPLADRKPKRIVYHTNVGFPKDRWPAVEVVAKEWNKVFTETVRLTHNIAECSPDGVSNALISYEEGIDGAIRKSLDSDEPSQDVLTSKSEASDKVDELAKGQLEVMNAAELRGVCDVLKAEAKGGTPFVQLTLDAVKDPKYKALSDKVQHAWSEMAYGVTSDLQTVCGNSSATSAQLSEAIDRYFGVYAGARSEVLGIFASSADGQAILKNFSYGATYSSKDPVLGVQRSLALQGIRGEFIKGDGEELCSKFRGALDGSDPLIAKLQEIPGASSYLKSVKVDTPAGKMVKDLIEVSNGTCSTVEPKYKDDGHGVKPLESSVERLELKEGNCSRDMYVILPNSCSTPMLMDWKEKHSGLYDVDVLFEGMNETTFDGMTPKELEQFCAKLELATENAPKEKDRFTWQRIGDLHYSFINYVSSDVPWLGYGPSAADPETGEIISGNANFAGKVLDSYAQSGVDRYKIYKNGSKITEDEFIWGDYLREEVRGKTEEAGKRVCLGGCGGSRSGMRSLIGSGSDSQTLSGKDLVAKASGAGQFPHYPALDDNISDRIAGKNSLKVDPELMEKLQNGFAEQVNRAFQQSKVVNRTRQEKIDKVLSMPEVRSARLADPDFFMMVQEVGKERFGKETLSDDELAQAYAEVSNPLLVEAARKQFRRKLAERNIMTLDGLEEAKTNVISYMGVTDYFQDKEDAGMSEDEVAERLRNYFLNGVFYSTQLHEVGHTVGLRHNFQASTDAMNYDPIYWDLRAKLAEDQEAVENAVKKVKEDPGYKSLTDAEKAKKVEDAKNGAKALIQQQREGSDYCEGDDAKALTDEKDLLYLSKSRVKCLLGGVEIERPYFSETEFREASIMDYTPGLTSGFNGLGRYDNAAIQFAYGNKVEVFTDEVPIGAWDRFQIEQGVVQYKKFPQLFAKKVAKGGSEAMREKLGIERMTRGRTFIDADEAKKQILEQLQTNAKMMTEQGKKGDDFVSVYRSVPYGFCSDEREGGQLGCSVFDYGVTESEILQYKIDDFRVNKNYMRYRRGRKDEAAQFVRNYIGWVSNAMSAVQRPFYFYSIYKWYGDIGDFTDDLESTAAMGLNFIAEVFAQPEPGPYCIAKNAGRAYNPLFYSDYSGVYLPLRSMRNDLSACASDPITIDRHSGAFNGFKTTNEYHWRYTRVAGFLDKQLAIQMMFNITGFSNQQALFDDIRVGNASYWTTFQDQIYNFTKDVILERMDGLAGVMENGVYTPPEIVDPKTIGDVFDKLSTTQKGLPRVYTSIGFSNEWYAMISAMAANDTFFDNSPNISEFMAVCLTADECNKDYSGYDVRTFSHPVTPQTYFVPIAKNGESITAEVVKKLDVLKDEYLKADKQSKDTNASEASRKSAATRKDNASYIMESLITKLDRIRYIKKALGK